MFATPEYAGTKLAKFIVPTTKLFEIYHFSDLGPLNMPHDTIYKNDYNKKLSSKQQYKSDNKFKNKYPTIDYVIQNSDSIGDTILNDGEILNNLSSFNKVGMTMVKPLYPDEVVSLNYDSSESIYYGCQFTTMNFQVNDINMQNYLVIFKESSFRLKPSSLRFSEEEEPVEDISKMYKSIAPRDENIINEFFYKYENLLIAIESYTLRNTYLTQIESNLRFRLGVNNNIDITQCFIPRKSTTNSAGNISLYLESASNGMFITLNTNLFDLKELSNNRKDLLNQALYIEYPQIKDDEIQDKMISIRTTDDETPMYLAYENKIVKAYGKTTQLEAKNNMSFILHILKFTHIIKFITIFNGSVKTMDGNILGVLENNTKNGTEYYVIPSKKSNSSKFNIFTDQFMLQNKKKRTYVSFDPNTEFLYDRDNQPNSNSIFNMVSTNGFYTILNTSNDNLAVIDNNLLKFVKGKDIVSNENLFMIDITYELL